MKANLGHFSVIANKVTYIQRCLKPNSFFAFFTCSEKVGEKLVHVFFINTEKTVTPNKIITIDSYFVFAWLVCSSMTMFIIYLCVYNKKHYSYTQTGFYQRVNHICYLNLIVCCKTSEGEADLDGPIIFKLFCS